ncbi:MAG TPA: c-type cytochrome [Candidimonas sp.]|nr:c-type cytochrome [Candidimonas sp.]
MRVLALVVMIAMSAAVSAAEEKADAKGDAIAGATKAAVCLSCHGGNGAKPLAPIYPSLSGQSAEYLASSLQAYRDGHRQGAMAAMMSPQAATLSDQDILDLAAFYSEQDPCAKPK